MFVEGDGASLCVTCAKQVTSWFWNAEDAEIEAFFGGNIDRTQRNEALFTAMKQEGEAGTHWDMAVAYEQMGLRGDAVIELAIAATRGVEDAVKRLFHIAVRRRAGALLARSIGIYVRRVSR